MPRTFLPLLSVVLLCGDQSGLSNAPPFTLAAVERVSSVTVRPDTMTLEVGDPGLVTCEPMTSSGAILDYPCKWESSDPTQATVTARAKQARVTALRSGSLRITAAVKGWKDTLRLTVTDTAGMPPPAPPPDTTAPPPPTAEGCPASGYLRLVNVSTTTQRNSAIANALPGDQIRLAPGTYAGAMTTITRSGTAANPIVICGPRTAVMDLNRASNVRLQANYWIFQGFRITDFPSTGFHIGPDAQSANNHHNTIDSLEIDNSIQELLAINGYGHHNIIRKTSFHHSGKSATSNAEEGVYVCESDNTTVCLGNQILFNTFECIGTEHVDLKGGADSTVVEGNIMDGRCEQGPDTLQTKAVPGNAVSIISVASKHNRIVGNEIFYGNPHGIQLWKTSLGWSQNSQVDSNTIHLFNRTNQSAPRAINASTGVTFKSCLDNVITDITAGGAKYGGVAIGACTP